MAADRKRWYPMTRGRIPGIHGERGHLRVRLPLEYVLDHSLKRSFVAKVTRAEVMQHRNF
jgi:hypothetical protein